MQERYSDFILTKATIENLEEVVFIEKLTQQQNPWNFVHFLEELLKKDNFFFVLTQKNIKKIIGYSVIQTDQSIGYLINFTIHSHYQCQGIGQWMLQELIHTCINHKMTHLHLDVRQSNASAIHIYEKFQFNTTSLRKNFYSNGETAYQMTRLL